MATQPDSPPDRIDPQAPPELPPQPDEPGPAIPPDETPGIPPDIDQPGTNPEETPE